MAASKIHLILQYLYIHVPLIIRYQPVNLASRSKWENVEYIPLVAVKFSSVDHYLTVCGIFTREL